MAHSNTACGAPPHRLRRRQAGSVGHRGARRPHPGRHRAPPRLHDRLEVRGRRGHRHRDRGRDRGVRLRRRRTRRDRDRGRRGHRRVRRDDRPRARPPRSSRWSCSGHAGWPSAFADVRERHPAQRAHPRVRSSTRVLAARRAQCRRQRRPRWCGIATAHERPAASGTSASRRQRTPSAAAGHAVASSGTVRLQRRGDDAEAAWLAIRSLSCRLRPATGYPRFAAGCYAVQLASSAAADRRRIRAR